jgi:uncharacterized repeat protein (TIGR01451 family)
MRKIIGVIIPLGLVAIFTILISINTPPAEASSKNSITTEDITGHRDGGPPWYDPAWNYRRPVVISNSGPFISFYQVLIKLDITNFDFTRAKPDGSDVRFTDSSGKTPLLFWIESWDKPNELAYMWVLVSSITPEPYDTTIYLYFDNPNAPPVNDAQSPFDFFDDNWCQFEGSGCKLEQNTQQIPSGEKIGISAINNQPANNMVTPAGAGELINGYTIGSNTWITLTSQSPTVASGVLTLNNNTGIKTNNPFQSEALGFRANYGLGNGHEWVGFINGSSGQRTTIGDLPVDLDDLYLINYADDNSTMLVGDNDWHNAYHVYEIRWKPGESIGDIDHGLSTAANLSQVPNIQLPVTLYNNNTGANSTLKVDWVYVRQYRDPEPTSSVKAAQGLVELSIENIDYPDPLRKDDRLTYQLTIANNSSINAPGVVVTDTLPANVEFGPISYSQGSCEPGSVVLCDLNSIPANSMATITIVVTPTVDGVITNTAQVGSMDFDLDLSDNFSVQSTLVDSESPNVTWEIPATNGNIFFTFGGTTLLKVQASDNDQIDKVEFWWHDGVSYLPIVTLVNPPYQTSFNTSLLSPEIPYWFEARAYDRAGNSNYPYNRSYIYIIRHPINFLPLMYK